MNGIQEDEGNILTSGVQINNQEFKELYTVEERIGSGRFGNVKRCRHRITGKEYAAKFQRKRRMGENCRDTIMQEMAMLAVARQHAHLVALTDAFETTTEMVIVTELAAGGELFQYLVQEESVPESLVVRWMRQIIHGLVFLHDRNIVHLDVKPQNIVLISAPPDSDVKICDFGFARTVDSGEDVRDIIGTPDYVAPEVLQYNPISTSCDMWSVGVLAYVLLTGYSPFEGDDKMATFSNITSTDVEFPEDIFEGISDEAIAFIDRLLDREPSARMTARQCLEHDWLRLDNCREATPMATTTTTELSQPDSDPRLLTPAATSPTTAESSPVATPPQVLICKPDHPVHRTPVGDSPVVHRRAEKMISISPSDVDMTTSRSSPFGSPVGTRRALTPSPDGTLDETDPIKRCKCASSNSIDVDVTMSSNSIEEVMDVSDNRGSVDLSNGIHDMAMDTKDNNNTAFNGNSSSNGGRFLTVLEPKQTKLLINRMVIKDVEKENTPLSKEH